MAIKMYSQRYIFTGTRLRLVYDKVDYKNTD